MTYTRSATLIISLFLFSACAMFEAKQPAAPRVSPAKELSVPVGRNWKMIEEAPDLTNERNPRPAFQTEQSVQPEGSQRPAPPTEKERTIETPR